MSSNPSRKWCRVGVSALAFVALAASSSTAFAQPAAVTLELVSGPAVDGVRVKVDDTYDRAFQLAIGYDLTGGTYRNLEVTLTLPPYVTPTLSSHEGTFTYNGCPQTAGVGSPRDCRWSASTLAVGTTGVAGTINLTLQLDRWRFLDGEPLAFTARATGLHTPQGGTESAFDVADQPLEILADPAQQVAWQSGTGLVEEGWVEVPGTPPTNGLRLRFSARFTNGFGGSAKLRNAVATSRVGADFELVSAPTAVSPWATPVVDDTASDGSFEVINTFTDDAPPTFNDTHYDSTFFYIELFVPCAVFDSDTRDLTVSTELTWDERFYEPDGTPRDEPRTLTHLAQVQGYGACGTGGHFNKGTELWWPAPEDGYALTGIYMRPPVGVSVATNALVVDDMPPGTAFRSFHTAQPTQFTFYGCNFAAPNDAGDISLAFFQANIAACVDLAGWDRDNPLGVTHIIAHAPTWGGAAEPLQQFTMRYETYIPPGYVAADLPLATTNVAYAHFGYTLDGASYTVAPDPTKSFADDPWKDDAPVTIDPTELNACSAMWGGLEGGSAIAPRAPSPDNRRVAVFRPTADSSYARLENPRLTVTLPPRVRAVATEIVPVEAWKCPGLSWVSDTATPATDTLTFTGTGLQTIVGPAGRCYDIKVTIEPDADGWVNGETFDVVGYLTGDNNDPTCDARRVTHTFSLSVPAELRVDVAPTCSGNAADPAFDVTARNNGGVDFAAASLRFPIPSGTTLRAVVAPPDVSIACDLGAGPVACPPDPAAAVAVVASGFSLAAPDESRTIKVKLATALPPGSAVVGSASATAGQLTASSGETAPFVVGECRYPIRVSKHFDADQSGDLSAGDTPLANWVFTITPADTADAPVVTTDVDGIATFLVKPGTYQITEQLPATVDGVVWQASGGALTQEVFVPVDPATPVAADFLNTCTCQAAQCMVAVGQCTPSGCVYDDEPDCASEPVYHIPVRTPAGLAVVVCRLALAPEVGLTCDPPDPDVAPSCGGTP